MFGIVLGFNSRLKSFKSLDFSREIIITSIESDEMGAGYFVRFVKLEGTCYISMYRVV